MRTALSHRLGACGLVSLAFLTLTAQAGPAVNTAPAPSDPVLARFQMPAVQAPRLVFALYYPWYGLKQVSGADRHVEGVSMALKRVANFVHFPVAGPYDSTDEKTIARHMGELKKAGVDVVTASWWGLNDHTHAAFKKVLARAPREGLRACLYLEQLGKPGDVAATSQELSVIAASIGRDPAYLKVDGKPVFFLFGRAKEQLNHEQWIQVIANVEKAAAPGLILIADGNSFLDSLVFDGLHTNIPPLAVSRTNLLAGNGELQTALVQAAEKRGRISVATVFPGFDNRKGNMAGFSVDRQNGDLYRRTWETALGTQPDWILIRSYNQWHDGTEIEPSVEFGDRFLKITAEYAEKFRSATPATQRTPKR